MTYGNNNKIHRRLMSNGNFIRNDIYYYEKNWKSFRASTNASTAYKCQCGVSMQQCNWGTSA